MSEHTILQELLSRHQVRKSQKQKREFEAWAQKACEERGFTLTGEDCPNFLHSRNLIAGNPEKARIIFTAHYDTCAESPVPNRVYPQNMLATLLIQMPLVLVILAAALCVQRLAGPYLGLGRRLSSFLALAVYFSLFVLIFFGKANPHTANDNSSGVAALLRIMEALPEDARSDAAFIFFDHEEMGKIGSKQYARMHPGITEGKILLNLDCVGDGNDMLIVAPKQSDEKLDAILRAAFQDEGDFRAVHCSAKKTSYNSDQKSFPNGVAVAACRRDRLGYHVPRIHTRRDVICEQSNLDYVTRGALNLMRLTSEQKKGG